MSIGLYDRDFLANPATCVYNLQLMKLATYYKARNEIVGLITDLSHANHCEKVYYRHDDINIPAPDDLYKYDNIDIGGYAIYDKYIPLKPEIEKCEPDYTIYEPFWEKASKKYKKERVFHTCQIAGTHVQLSRDGKHLTNEEINFKVEPKPRHIILHDNHIEEIEGYCAKLKELGSPRTTNFILKYPQDIHDLNFLVDFVNIGSHIALSGNIYVHSDVSLEQFKSFIKSNQDRQFFKKLFFYIYQENEQDEQKRIIEVFKKSLYAKSLGERYYNFIFKEDELPKTEEKLYYWISEWSSIKTKRCEYLEAKLVSFNDYMQKQFLKEEEDKEIYYHYYNIPEMQYLFNIHPMDVAKRKVILT